MLFWGDKEPNCDRQVFCSDDTTISVIVHPIVDFAIYFVDFIFLF